MICQALQQDLLKALGTDKPLQVYIDKLQEHARTKLTPSWAMAPMKPLFAVTLPAIIEHGGQYPPKRMR